jgi:hypothetical protein
MFKITKLLNGLAEILLLILAIKFIEFLTVLIRF